MNTLAIIQDVKVHGLEIVRVEISPDAFVLREKVLAQARKCKGVTSDASRAFNHDVLKELKGLSKQVEAGRKREKAPIDKVVKDLQAAVQDFQLPIQEDIDRIERDLGAYELELRKQAEEEDRKRRAELAALERKKFEADEKIRLAARSGDKDALDKALDAKNDLKKDIVQAMVPVKAEKLEGGHLRVDWVIEIIDEREIQYKRPDLGVWTASIPKIKQALDRGETVPGIKAEKVAKMGARS